MGGRQPIKIFHLRSSGGIYGAENVILTIARELKRKNCENYIVCINNLDNPHSELIDQARKYNIPASAVDSIGQLDMEAITEIRRKLKDGGFHILHCHDYKASLYGLFASWRLPVRRVVTNHLWDAVDWKLWLYQRLEGLSYNWFDRVIAVSERVKRDVRPYIIHKSKIEVITNGISVEQFAQPSSPDSQIPSSPEDSKSEARGCGETGNLRCRFGLKNDDVVIGIVGRLARQKGHASLLKAFSSLKSQVPSPSPKDSSSPDSQNHRGTEESGHGAAVKSLRLLVVGDGDLEMELKEQCRELDLPVFDLRDFHDKIPPPEIFPSCSVIFSGVQTDMPAVYRALDLLVMPSLQEGLPMALLEAMVSGVPVAASPVGQIPQIITDRETGFIIDPADTDGMARVLADIIKAKSEEGRGTSGENTGEAVNQIVKRARSLVESQHSSKAMARKYLETYEWLAE